MYSSGLEDSHLENQGSEFLRYYLLEFHHNLSMETDVKEMRIKNRYYKNRSMVDDLEGAISSQHENDVIAELHARAKRVRGRSPIGK